MGIVLTSFYEFLLKFETVPTVWYVLFLISSLFLEIVNNDNMQKNTQCNGQNKMKRRNRQQNTQKNILTLTKVIPETH